MAINIKEHFELSEQQKMDRGEIEFLASYSEDICENVINESISKAYKVDSVYDDMVFGQMCMIEQILSSEMEAPEKIVSVLSLFYRPVSEEVFDNSNAKEEESNDFYWSKMPAGCVLKLFDRFIELRKEFFFERYEDIIYEKKEPQNDSEEPVERPKDFETEFYRVFGWYEKQRTIAKELNMTIDQVLMMNVNSAMVELSYQKNKAKLESIKNKFNNNGNRN